MAAPERFLQESGVKQEIAHIQNPTSVLLAVEAINRLNLGFSLTVERFSKNSNLALLARPASRGSLLRRGGWGRRASETVGSNFIFRNEKKKRKNF